MEKEKNIKQREKKEHLFVVIYCWKQQSIDKKIIYQLANCPFVIPLYQKKKKSQEKKPCIEYFPTIKTLSYQLLDNEKTSI